MPYRLVAGLGNPGAEYEHTRHNAGFMVLDLVAKQLNASYWKAECGAQAAHVTHNNDELILAKPQAFMNTSGGPISKLAAKYNIAVDEILVIHDDMDIPAGEVRIKVAGGHAGHNGLRSLHAKLASDAYTRVRVGIAHPAGRKEISDYVLGVPKGDEASLFEHAVHMAADAVCVVLEHGPQTAMNQFN